MYVCKNRCSLSMFLELIEAYPAPPEDKLRLILSHMDSDQRNVMWYAVAYGCVEICEFLLASGEVTTLLPDKVC
jgi:hypothetical protein